MRDTDYKAESRIAESIQKSINSKGFVQEKHVRHAHCAKAWKLPTERERPAGLFIGRRGADHHRFRGCRSCSLEKTALLMACDSRVVTVVSWVANKRGATRPRFPGE